MINKLLYFGAPIPGTRQNLKYHSDKAMSYLKWIRIDSDDTKMFNFFQSFSAADLHWPDLHRLLPNSKEYLGKEVVDNMEAVEEGERHNCIEKTEDFRLRAKAVRDNQDVVAWHFFNRIQLLMKHVLPTMKITDYIIRYEVQHRELFSHHDACFLTNLIRAKCNSQPHLSFSDQLKTPPKELHTIFMA